MADTYHSIPFSPQLSPAQGQSLIEICKKRQQGVSLSLADVDLLLDLICTPLPVRSGMDLDLEAQQLRPPRPDINLYFPGSILAAVLLWTAVILLAPRLWHVAVWLWWAL